jgi:hypothetical protein
MYMNAQEEVAFFLRCATDQDGNMNESSIPRQILYHILDLYERSLKGYRVNPMNHLLYDFEYAKEAADILNAHTNSSSFRLVTNSSLIDSNQLLNNKENTGFLYFRPTRIHQERYLAKLAEYLPSDTYMLGYMVHKWEIPWAKLFPLRLFLRLGEQFECN